MQRVFLALVCAAVVWFVPSIAIAAIWDCHIDGEKRLSPLHEYKPAIVDIAVDDVATGGPDKVLGYAIGQWRAAHPVPITGDRRFSMFLSRCTERRNITPSTKPITGGSYRSAPTKKWVCRVDITWHVGPRTGRYSGIHGNEEPTEAAAMGRALFDAQQYLLARTLKNTKPSWSKTDVNCS